MKKAASLLIIALAVLSAAYAADYGMDLSASAGISTKDGVAFSGSIVPKPGIDLTLGSYLQLLFKGSANLSFSSSDEVASTYPGFPVLFDLDELRFLARFPKPESDLSSLTLSFGRFMHSDPTGYSFAHRLDGFSLTLNYPVGALEVTSGYTGFIWRWASGVEMSITDLAMPEDNDHLFAAPRFIASVVYRSPKFLNSTAYLSALVQEDLRDGEVLVPEWTTTAVPGKGGAIDTQYISAGLNGEYMENVACSAFFTLNTGREMSWIEDPDTLEGAYRYSSITAFLFGMSASVSLPDVFGMDLGGGFLYGSGDEDAVSYGEGSTSGNATSFTPVTASGTGLVFSPRLGNIMIARLSASAQPFSDSRSGLLKGLRTSLTGLAFLRSTTGPVSESGIVTGSDSHYLGSEFDATVGVNIFSDLTASVSAGVFLPGEQPFGAFDPAASGARFTGKLYLDLSI